MAALGILLALGAIGSAGLVEERTALPWLAIAGGLLFMAGVVYAAVRQLRVRRHLPPERYRGPAVLLLLLLVLVVAAVLAVPFAEDADALVLGEGRLSTAGAIVLLVGTQAALLAVSWLFVFRPRALVGWPSWSGPDPAAAIRSGLGWGLLAWIGATAVSVIVVVVLEQFGIEADPQAAEQALFVVDPWLAVVAIVILAPVAEEVFFRGVVFNAWLREGGPRYAFIGSSLLFMVLHLSVAAAVPIFLLGLALAWIYRRTGNLLAPIAMHATVNGISVVLALLARFELLPMPV